MNAIAERNEDSQQVAAPVRSASPIMDLVSHAVQSGQPIEVIRELMAMSKELAADEAKRAFDAAVADAKAEISAEQITKNATGHNNKRYANFAAYAGVVDPILGKHGLSYRFRTEQNDKIKVYCILSHKAGHSEENSLEGPADASGSKNAIQAVGSTLTYLQRYSLIQALGLAATDDDDGRSTGKNSEDFITSEQEKELLDLIQRGKGSVERFCQMGRIEKVADLPAAQYQAAKTMLVDRIAKVEAGGTPKVDPNAQFDAMERGNA